MRGKKTRDDAKVWDLPCWKIAVPPAKLEKSGHGEVLQGKMESLVLIN